MKQAILTKIQRFSLDDGPGIRTTVFFKGCTLRCRWCHNPECISPNPELLFFRDKCIGCGACAAACPHGAHTMEQGIHQYDPTKCQQCYACVAVCPKQALLDAGRPWELDTLLQLLLRDRDFYETSGGGVTVSGGEPLCQPDFTMAVFKELKARGIHTALDTTGYVPWGRIEAVLPYTDLFLYDLKHMDSHDHNVMVKVPNERILENALKIAERGGKMQVRVPVIPSFNDSEENLRATAEFCLRLGDALTVIQLLPYHNLGVMKYQRLDEDAVVMEAIPHTDEQVQGFRDLIASYELPVTVH